MFQKKLHTKIMVFGTFDGLHLGHLNFFKQARKLAKNPYLIVSVARNQNIKKIKGRNPSLSVIERKNLIKKCGLADKVVLSGVKNYLPHIIKEKPEIIALGYDQTAYVEELKTDLKKIGLKVKVVRLKPFQEKIYKNSLLRKSSV